VVATVWEGEGVIAAARLLIGSTNPLVSNPGTIRGDFGVSVGRNIIHGSDAPETAQQEISLWFKPEELIEWEPSTTSWLYE
jgi:nucleoside-diphosphate kinase